MTGKKERKKKEIDLDALFPCLRGERVRGGCEGERVRVRVAVRTRVGLRVREEGEGEGGG